MTLSKCSKAYDAASYLGDLGQATGIGHRLSFDAIELKLTVSMIRGTSKGERLAW